MAKRGEEEEEEELEEARRRSDDRTSAGEDESRVHSLTSASTGKKRPARRKASLGHD